MSINTEEIVKGTANAASTLTGDQVIAEVQEILQTEGFGLFQMFARPSQTNGSVFTYKTPERMIPEAYDRTTNGALGKGAVVPQVDITANIRDVVYMEIEDTEFATQVLADAEKSRVANSIVQSMMAQLDAEAFMVMKDAVEAGVAEQVVKVGFTTAADQDALATARMLTGDVIAENESIIDAKTLGVPSIRQMIIGSPKFYWRYINSFDTNVREQSEEIKVGNLSLRLINGAAVIKHPLIGGNHAAGTLHKTKAFDLSTITAKGGAAAKLEAFVLTDIAIAMPFTLRQTRTRINKFGNDEIISRYVFGKGAIRPALIKALTV